MRLNDTRWEAKQKPPSFAYIDRITMSRISSMKPAFHRLEYYYFFLHIFQSDLFAHIMDYFAG